MRNATILIVILAVVATPAGVAPGQATTKPAPGPTTRPTARTEIGKAFVENWNWPRQMLPYAKKFKGAEGVVMFIGDSLAYSAPATAWARFFAGNADKPVYSDSDKVILKWSHADEPEKDTNGWWLSAVDRPTNRSETCAGGLDTAECLKGGVGGLPSLAELLKKYAPQVVMVQLSLNDVRYNKPDESAANMGKIIDAALEAGAVPVLITLPPRRENNKAVIDLNDKYRQLADTRKLPVIDLYAEMLALQPGEKWQGTLIGDDGVFPTANTLTGPCTEENLKHSGYLLRCWLTVEKLKEIKSKVIDKK